MKAIDNITHEIRMVVSSGVDVVPGSLMRMGVALFLQRAEIHTVASGVFPILNANTP